MTAAEIPESHCDVLIIGAGPAGLMLATQLAQLGVNARIVDKMPHPVLRGHADGIHARTSEVLESMGLYAAIRDEGLFWKEGFMWDCDGDVPRVNQQVDYDTSAFSRLPAGMLGQAVIERNFIQEMERHGMQVERLLAPRAMEVDEGRDYPVRVELHSVPPPEGWDERNGLYRSNIRVDNSYAHSETTGAVTEIVRCKYLVGCDGAHSWVRRTIGLVPEGERTSSFFGAMDVVLDTDLTTLGGINIFQRHGHSIVLLPREGDMVRIYVPLGTSGEPFDRKAVSCEKLVAILKDWLSPHRVNIEYVDWWTVYEVAQRCTPSMEAHSGRVLIAGDACHTHSPKAGQGMNVSMLDGFNLGWKLAGVLKGTHHPDVARTYSPERHQVAAQLIAFDKLWSSYFTGQRKAEPGEFGRAFKQSMKWMSGTAVLYDAGLIVAGEEEHDSHCASEVKVGSHFENAPVKLVFNSMEAQLQTRMRANGLWKVVLFPGDVVDGTIQEKLSAYTADLTKFVKRFTRGGNDLDSVIEVITVFKSPHSDVQNVMNSFEDVLRPRRTVYGVKQGYAARDTLYADVDGAAYVRYGVDDAAAVLVRPDQHVAGVFEMNNAGLQKMDKFLSRVLVPVQ